MLMDQRKLDPVKTALNAATETETVDTALDVVTFCADLFRDLDELAAAGGVANIEPRSASIDIRP